MPAAAGVGAAVAAGVVAEVPAAAGVEALDGLHENQEDLVSLLRSGMTLCHLLVCLAADAHL